MLAITANSLANADDELAVLPVQADSERLSAVVLCVVEGALAGGLPLAGRL
jgi:hypothetical protein